jgi:hypothetical protein
MGSQWEGLATTWESTSMAGKLLGRSSSILDAVESVEPGKPHWHRVLFQKADSKCWHCFGRPAEGIAGAVRLTIFLGGGAIAAEELEYADALGVPWVYIPCK